MTALAILNAHVAEFSYPEWRCSCGWRKVYATTPFHEQHRRHLAQLLAVPVPEPSEGEK